MVSRARFPLDLWVNMTTEELQETINQRVENIKRLQKLYERCIQRIACPCDSCLDDCSRKKEENCIRSVDCLCDSCRQDSETQVEVIESMRKSFNQEDKLNEDLFLTKKENKRSELSTMEDWKPDGALNLFDELLELGSTYVSCLFLGLVNILIVEFFAYGFKEQNDATVRIFDPGGIVFDWWNQLKEILDGDISAASASILLFLYSLNYDKVQLVSDTKFANKWMVRWLNRTLEVCCNNVKYVDGELEDILAGCLLGCSSINGIVPSVLMLFTTSRTLTTIYKLIFYEKT